MDDNSPSFMSFDLRSDLFNMGFEKDDVYNVSVSLSVVKCSTDDNPTAQSSSEGDGFLFNNWDFALSHFYEPLPGNLMEPYHESDDGDNFVCNTTLDRTITLTVYPLQVRDWLFVFILLLFFIPVLYYVVRKMASLIKSRFSSRQTHATTKDKVKKMSKVAPLLFQEQCISEETALTGDITDTELPSTSIKETDIYPAVKLPPSVLKTVPSDRKGCQLDKGDVGKFLAQTLDLLNTGLNRMLWKTSSSGGTLPLQLSSPTLPRRWSSAQGSSGSLNLRRTGRSVSNLSSIDLEEMTLECWDEFEETLQHYKWQQSRNPKVNRSRVGGEVLQQILRYLENNLSSDGAQWRAASMLTTYFLSLVEKELQRLPNAASLGLKFVEFLPLGSCNKGTKIGKPNAFDVLMVLQPTCSKLKEAMVGGETEGLPPGKTILVLAETGMCTSKRFFKEVSIHGVKTNCMVTRQTAFTAHGLLDGALAEIASKCRKLAEKIPYRVQKIESKPTHSKIIIDTKAMNNIGFNVEEIGINITPCVCIADGGLQCLPIYAVPNWNQRNASSARSVSVPKRSDSLEPEIMWSLCTTSLEEAYYCAIRKRMKLCGIDSCHVTCLLVLKTLLQHNLQSEKDQISGYWLETIVNFLLLESAPEMWTYDCLTNRISDALVFLKRALQNQRLPHFFIGNPHLMKQFPYLKMFPWLSGDKQVNLMSSLSEQSAENLMKYVIEQKRTVAFKHAIREDFSAEMWEYEFFVFS